MSNLIKLALCMLPTILAADFYSIPAQLHLKKDGMAIIEIDGHFYDLEYIDHSNECPCMEYVIDTSKQRLN